MSVDKTKTPCYAQFGTNEAVQGAYVVDSSKVYKEAAASGSFDPFASKTNKFAESTLIEVSATLGVHIKFGDSDITDATTSDWYIAANFRPFVFAVDKDKPYVRIIPASGTPDVYVREIA